MIKKILFQFSLLISSIAICQIPAGYYNSATGSGYTLKTQLHNIIDGHTAVSYADLWNEYNNTDIDPNDGYIWDMYSENPNGTDPYNHTYSTDQCGNYNSENDCYNREHSFPKSWFNDANPMHTDIFHVVPTDGYVNGQRSNLPYGEVGSANWTGMNGSKRGSARAGLGYSGTVFEPIDEYKGDFARIYFYMATRYEDVVSGWPGSAMLDGSSNKVFTTWALNMLIDWHTNDPISTKEINRNNYIYYNIQGNRNPFVDNPTYVYDIWGGAPGPTYCNQTMNKSICSGDFYNFNGTNISQAGQYRDTVSGGSCDSIYILNLTVNQPINVTLPDINICSGQSVNIFGNQETVANTYSQTYTSNSTGCDSTATVTLNVSNSISTNTSLTLCESNYQFGTQNLTQTGIYTESFDLGGCDSTVTLQLVLNPINTSVSQNGNTLTASQNGVLYQWLDCQNGFSKINGETSNTFTSISRGFFAVEITNGSCKDTSECFQLNDVIDNMIESKAKTLNIYPNPTDGLINIKTDIENLTFKVVNLIGEVVFSSSKKSFDLSHLESGVYFIKSTNEEVSFCEKIILN